MPSTIKKPYWRAFKDGYKYDGTLDYFPKILAWVTPADDGMVKWRVYLPNDLRWIPTDKDLLGKALSFEDAFAICEFLVDHIMKAHRPEPRPDGRGKKK